MTSTLQRQAAIEILRQPFQDRQRGVFCDLSGMHITDDSGGEPIWSLDDVTAVHHFLKWMDDQRRAYQAERQTVISRSQIKLLKGARHAE
jgi:hypothetical protein